MFIGGLNWDTTDGTYYSYWLLSIYRTQSYLVEALRDYFTQFGKVDACTIMRDAAGRSRCFAFLTFEDPASVNAVMVREHFLDGKIVRQKHFEPVVVGISPSFSRLTLSGRSLDKNISEQLNCLLAALLAASPLSRCGSSFLNSEKLSTRQLCWTVRQGEARVLASFLLKTPTSNLSWVSVISRLTEN